VLVLLLVITRINLIKTQILDGKGRGTIAHVHKFAKGEHSGLLTLTNRFFEFDPEFHPFLNDNFGTAMNQNAAFSGTPEIIHNGGSSVEWDAAAIQGVWNFADSAKITITGADNNDEAVFSEEGATTIDMSGFTALTGKVDLDVYNSVNNSIIVQFDLAGVLVGNSVDLNDFIDTGDFTEQNFVIPKADLGLTTQLLDGMSLLITRTGGTKPTIKFDDIQFEQTGNPIVFTASTPRGTIFCVTELRIALADNIASTVANGTMEGLAYDDFMGITSPLSNGVLFARTKKGEVVFNVSIKQLGDFLSTGSNLVNHISDGTNTFITLLIEFPEPIVLDGDNLDKLTFTINDDLSGLLQFTAAARGAIRSDPTVGD